MGDYLAPYKEGFENPSISRLFDDLLKFTPKANRVSNVNIKGASGGSSSTACAVTSSGTGSTAAASGEVNPVSPRFLSSIIQEQLVLAESLMETAKKMSPVSKNIASMERAYDAAFETDITAPTPTISGSLHGFTLVFFLLSFLALSIVVSTAVNQATNSTSAAIKTFAGFIVAFIVAISLITRFG